MARLGQTHHQCQLVVIGRRLSRFLVQKTRVHGGDHLIFEMESSQHEGTHKHHHGVAQDEEGAMAREEAGPMHYQQQVWCAELMVEI